jgi:arylsulfatase
VKESPRKNFFYVSDDGGIMAVRVGDYKLVFQEQHAEKLRVWQQPFVQLRLPDIMHLRRDPFERAIDNSNTYLDWMFDHIPLLYLTQETVAAQIEEYVKYPPRQKPTSFNLDAVMAQLGPAIKAYAEKRKELAAEKAPVADHGVLVGSR